MKPLRIGIDLTGIWRRPTGIFRYSAELVKHLLLLPKIEGRGDSGGCPAIDYVLFFSREVHPDFVPLQHAFEAVICPTSNELLCKQLWFPVILPRLHLDIMHYPAFPPPYVGLFSPPTVMTFYDAGPWRYPQAQTLHGRLYFRTLLSRGLRTCLYVTTLSTHARSEVGCILGERYLPKISVAPGAGRTEFGAAVSETEKQKVRTHSSLPDSYFLAVATIEPRKNLPTLLDAYARLRQACGGTCPELVIVGRKGWNCDDILQHMTALKESVHFLGHIPDQDLITVYQMALCLVFPSLYEGFGLPIIEAMTAGCPVIAANSSSLPEVAGDAALLVDALDAGKIAHAMQQVWQDEALRQSLIAAGRIQAARFSWEETARLTREVYLKVAQTPV